MKKGNKAVQSDKNLQQARKKAVHAELPRKRNVIDFIIKILVLFAAYRIRVAEP